MWKTLMVSLALGACSLPALAAGAADEPFPELTKGQPAPVKAIINRIVTCDHFGGEEAYDAARRQEMDRAFKKYKCATVEGDTAKILKQYKDQPQVIKAVNSAQHFSD